MQSIMITGGLLLIISLVGGGWAIIRWRRLHKDTLRRRLRDISHDVLVNFFVPDGNGGEIHIDHLLLTDRGLVLLETNDLSGAVFAGNRLDTWSAVSAIGRTTFENPISRLQDRTAAISFLAPGVPVAAKVLFVNEATFPKGHPASVVTIPVLLEEYASDAAGAEVRMFNKQWGAIKAAATFT